MTKYHVNNGTVGICKATKQPCPLENAEHYDDKSQAEHAATIHNLKTYGLTGVLTKPSITSVTSPDPDAERKKPAPVTSPDTKSKHYGKKSVTYPNDHNDTTLENQFATALKTITNRKDQIGFHDYLLQDSNLYHKECGNPVAQAEYSRHVNTKQNVYCDTCDTTFTPTMEDDILLKPNQQDLLTNPQTATSKAWYHTTVHKGWEDKYHSFTDGVHMGTLEASVDRAIALNNDFTRQVTHVYVHKISLSTAATVNPQVITDEDLHTSEASTEADVTPYINAWEGAGSISLVCKPSSFTVEKTEKVSIESFKEKYYSPYMVTGKDVDSARDEYM